MAEMVITVRLSETEPVKGIIALLKSVLDDERISKVTRDYYHNRLKTFLDEINEGR